MRQGTKYYADGWMKIEYALELSVETRLSKRMTIKESEFLYLRIIFNHTKINSKS